MAAPAESLKLGREGVLVTRLKEWSALRASGFHFICYRLQTEGGIKRNYYQLILLDGYLSQHNISLKPYWLLFNNHSEYIHVH